MRAALRVSLVTARHARVRRNLAAHDAAQRRACLVLLRAASRRPAPPRTPQRFRPTKASLGTALAKQRGISDKIKGGLATERRTQRKVLYGGMQWPLDVWGLTRHAAVAGERPRPRAISSGPRLQTKCDVEDGSEYGAAGRT